MAQQHATGKSAVWPSLSESRFARRVDLSDGLVKLAMRMHSIYIEIHMIHIIYIYIYPDRFTGNSTTTCSMSIFLCVLCAFAMLLFGHVA